jgi:hypothetical protein
VSFVCYMYVSEGFNCEGKHRIDTQGIYYTFFLCRLFDGWPRRGIGLLDISGSSFLSNNTYFDIPEPGLAKGTTFLLRFAAQMPCVENAMIRFGITNTAAAAVSILRPLVQESDLFHRILIQPT